MRFLVLGCVGLAAVGAVAAETDVGNLLPDYRLEDAAATWGLAEKPERGHIESFRGLWTPLDYVRVPAGTKFVREIQLETNAFYVLSWTQRGNFSGGLSVAGVTGKPPKYGREPIDRGMTAEGEWTDRRIVRWTHTNANFRVVLKESQGLTGEIGRIALRKMSDGEAADYAMDDPGFEKSVDADGFPVLVFWNPHLENEKPREFALPSGCRVRRVISCEGATIRPTERDGRLVLPLSDEPVYVIGERK